MTSTMGRERRTRGAGAGRSGAVAPDEESVAGGLSVMAFEGTLEQLVHVRSVMLGPLIREEIMPGRPARAQFRGPEALAARVGVSDAVAR